MVTVFCHQLGWKNMEMLVAQFQDRLHFGIHSELIELMKLPSLNGLRARSLFSAGLETIANVAAADINVVENALLMALPFQSEKQRDTDDDNEVKKRNKMKNVWITGHCGMTTREAAENLVHEARRYLQLELGVQDIKWDRTDAIKTDHELSHVINMKQSDNEQPKSALSTEEKNMTQKTQLQLNNIPECGLCRVDSASRIPELPVTENNSFAHTSNTAVQKEDKTNILNASVDNTPKFEIEWDSLNFTEVALSNVTKNRISGNCFSTPISSNESDIMFADNEKKTTPKSKEISSLEISKDLSLFSAEETDNSLFEDSLPLDQLSSRLLEASTEKCEISFNTESIANAFTSTIIKEDEDIKLVYDDDENKVSATLSNEQQGAEELKRNVDNTFSSPYKHKSEIDMWRKKRKRRNENIDPTEKSCYIIRPDEASTSTNVIKLEEVPTTNLLVWDKIKVSYYTIEENDVVLLDHVNTAALSFVYNKHSKNNFIDSNKGVIGSNICPSKPHLFNLGDQISMAIYCGFGAVLVLNTNWNHLTKFKMYPVLCQWLAKTKVRVASSKNAYWALKHLYELEMTSCYDVLLAQWLINTDEKDYTLETLVIHVVSIIIIIDFFLYFILFNWYIFSQIQKYSISNDIRNRSTALKCVAIWDIAERQLKSLLTKPHGQINLGDVNL